MFLAWSLSVASRKALLLTVLGLVLIPVPAAWSAYSDAEIRAVETDTEKQVSDLRLQEINQLRIALGRRLPTNRRADLYMRLAEIYIEGYRSTFLLEGRIHDKKLEQGIQDKFI